MNKILKTILCVIIITAICLAVFLIFEEAVRKQEIRECYQWQEQAEQFEGFFLAGWQEEQCSHYQIIIK